MKDHLESLKRRSSIDLGKQLPVAEDMNNQEQEAKPLLFALALYAAKINRSESAGDVRQAYDVQTAIIMELAQSDDEAHRLGMDDAMKRWPESEGYFNHHVMLGSMPA